MAERLRYTVIKRGKLFWQPTAEMRARGFEAMPLGADTPEARDRARKLAEAWDKTRETRDPITRYPPASFGAFWDHLRRSPWWARKGLRAREDYERAWVRIDAWQPKPGGPALSWTRVDKITPDLCDHFYTHLAATASPRERWRTFKAFKVLIADAWVRLQLGPVSPASRLQNPQPAGRSEIWLGAEIEDMAAGAALAGFEGLSFGIELAWQSMWSPVDVRTIRPSQLKRDGSGWYAEGSRAKTGKATFAYISDDLGEAVAAYLTRQNRAEGDNTPIIRQRDGNVYRDKDTFAGDFRDVRSFMFPGDTRQLMDIRRSANVEADAAGADKKTMGELLANGLADSRFLDDTYTPPTVAKAREVAEKRLAGRAKLAAEVGRLRSAN